MYKRLLISVITAATLSGCATIRRAPQNPALTEPPQHYADSLATLWYYTEGLKKSTVEKDTAAAGAYFRKALQSDSMHAPSWYELAALSLPSDPFTALKLSRKANEIDSTNIWYRSQLGRLLIGTENYSDALRLYEQLIREDPHNLMNYNMLAALYQQNKQPFTAIAVLDTAQYRLGRIEELSQYKQQLLIEVGLYDKAIEETHRLITDYPYKPENYIVLGNLYAGTRRDSLAELAYRAAVKLDSLDTDALSAAAAFYRQKGDGAQYFDLVKRLFASESLSASQKVSLFENITSDQDFYRRNYFAINSLASSLVLAYPNDYEVVEAYGGHLIRSGDVEPALSLFKSWVAQNRSRVEPYYSILDIEAYLERPDSVEKYSDYAIKLFPKKSDLYVRRGFAQYNTRQSKQAAKSYRQAYRYAADDSTRSAVLGIIGDLRHESGKAKECYRCYDRALKLDPDNAAVLNNYAYFLSEENRDLDKALAMSEKANALSAGNATYLDTRGWVLYRLGRYEEARKIVQQALSLDDKSNPELLLHYGDILAALGEDFMARIYWKRALENGADPKEIEKRTERKR